MMNQASTIPQSGLKNLQIAETALVLAASVLIQFVIHFIPPIDGVFPGQVLLPVFYAPLIALILFRVHVGLIAGILAPVINYLITGAPRMELVASLTFEVGVFVIAAGLLFRYTKTNEFTALLAIITAMVVTYFVSPLFFTNGMTADNFFNSVVLAIPGMLILSLINILMVRYKGNNG